jgi:hypothetical protein
MRLLFVLLAGGCFSPSYHSGGFRCATSEPACPSGYHCAGDGLCWHDGSDPDLGVGGEDMAGVDFAGVDFGGVDLSAPADLSPSSISYPPAAVWISSGGGSSSTTASQLNMTCGGSSTILGGATSPNGGQAQFGLIADDTF